MLKIIKMVPVLESEEDYLKKKASVKFLTSKRTLYLLRKLVIEIRTVV